MEPTILLIRHANTTYDTKVDAVLNPPLKYEGIKRIERTIDFLRKQEIPLDRIISSPLQRSLRVADMLSAGNLKVYPNNGLLPWNLGDLMGKETKDVQPVIDHLTEYPDIRAPHGESRNSFLNRWLVTFQKMLDYATYNTEKVLVGVTHSRNIDSIQELIGGEVTEVTEGSITRIWQEDGNWKHEIIWEGI